MILNDTIVAISTPPGRSGIGVVRLSGERALSIIQALLERPETPRQISLRAARGEDTAPALESPSIQVEGTGRGDQGPPSPMPRQATLTGIVDPDSGSLLDEAVVTYFQAPHSYTGEDVVELSCHGSPVVLKRVVQLALERGARVAEPGEFTLRAFMNGRMDLVQAEAIHDLIEARTLYQAQVAVQQAHGSLSKTLAPLKSNLVELISLLEAGIDFAEDDVSFLDYSEIDARMGSLLAQLAPILQSYQYGRLLREGLSLAIVGRPNVGKSSLFNRLLSIDRAIVTAIPGTTRDLITEEAQIHGIPIRLVDTAGIRDSTDVVEQEGVARAYAALADSDLVLLVVDASSEWTSDDAALGEVVRPLKHLMVFNKCDLGEHPGAAPVDLEGREVVRVSALTGEGMEILQQTVFRSVTGRTATESYTPSVITQFRHQQLLMEYRERLQAARAATGARQPHEVILLDLYGALRAMDSLTGATTVDDILGNIFSRFCVGK